MDAQLPKKIRFDAWTLDTQSGDLTKGEVTTRLQIQPLQILLALLENPGNLVPREQLIARLWPKGIVEFDTSLNTAVRKLRIALNDDSDNPRYIDTIPRRGYRFIAKIEPDIPIVPAQVVAPLVPVAERRAVPRPNRARARHGGGFAADRRRGRLLLLARHSFEAPSIVVLPLVDMSAEQKDSALCLAITEEISNRLAQLSTVRVVSRTLGVQIRGQECGRARNRQVTRRDVRRRRFGSPRRERSAGHGAAGQRRGWHSPLIRRSSIFLSENVPDIEQALSQSVAQVLRRGCHRIGASVAGEQGP